jgi:hypothetical protein
MDICGEKRNIRLAYIEGTRAVVLDSTEQVVQGIIWLDKKLPFYKFVALHCIWIVLHVMLSFFTQLKRQGIALVSRWLGRLVVVLHINASHNISNFMGISSLLAC